jgi:hypothetical protein
VSPLFEAPYTKYICLSLLWICWASKTLSPICTFYRVICFHICIHKTPAFKRAMKHSYQTLLLNESLHFSKYMNIWSNTVLLLFSGQQYSPHNTIEVNNNTTNLGLNHTNNGEMLTNKSISHQGMSLNNIFSVFKQSCRSTNKI